MSWVRDLLFLETLCRTRKGHVIICGVRHFLIARTKPKIQVLSLGLTLLLFSVLLVGSWGIGTE